MGRLLLPILWLFCVASLVGGCPATPDLDAPPDIRYGEDVCDQCRMIISEERFAAAYVTRDGTARRFDDIGDLVRFHHTHAEDVAVFWVHDAETRAWLRAESAFFVVGPSLHTPMGHGIAAAADRDRASRLAAAHGGQVMTFNQILRHAQTAADTAPVGTPRHHAETPHPEHTSKRRTTP